jgi:hypothetical protein
MMIDLRARSRKARTGVKSWFGRPPDAAEVGQRLHRLARRAFKRALVDATPKRVELAFHPAAPHATITVLADGDLAIRADATTLGAGYHREVLARIAPVLDELDYVLDGDGGDPEAALLGWLAAELRAGTLMFGIPIDKCFRVAGAAVLTAMGPRDAAWRDAVIADPARGADAFPWWERGPGTEARARALHALWFDVPWREPLDDAERALMEAADADLREARAAAPGLALPDADWALLVELLGDDPERARALRDRAGGAPATIGYRRHALDVELQGGWVLELGGAFVGRWDDERALWWASDGERVLELTTLTAPDATSSAALLDIAPPAYPVIEELADGRRCGRAEETVDDDGTYQLTGLMTCAPHVAILTCKGAVTDRAWALASWRSLRNV